MPVAAIVPRLTSAHEARSGTCVGLVSGEHLPDLSLVAKTCLYGFLQEALNNCMHHAPGVPPEVILWKQDGSLMVRVREDGPGFDTNGSPRDWVCRGSRERVAGSKGRFEVQARPGEGTEVSIWMPPDAGKDAA